jgi:hypothetical protein
MPVAENIAAIDTLHGAMKRGNRGTIDDDIVIGAAANRDFFTVELKTIGLGILSGDGNCDARHTFSSLLGKLDHTGCRMTTRKLRWVGLAFFERN